MIASIAIGTLVGVLFIGRSVAAPTGGWHGRPARLRGSRPASGIDGGARQRRDAFRPHRSGESRGAPQERAGIHARGGQHSGHHNADVDQLAGCSDRGIRPGGMGIPARPGGRNMGDYARASGGRLRSRLPRSFCCRSCWRTPTTMPRRRRPISRQLSAASPGAASGSLATGSFRRPTSRALLQPSLNREDAPLGTDERTRARHAAASPGGRHSERYRSARRDRGEERAAVTARTRRDHWRRTATPANAGPAAADGHRILNGWIARVPVTLMPAKPWDIGGNRYPLNVTATYQVGQDAEPHKFSARGAIEAEVSSAIYEMGAASSILPLLCFGAAFTRWRRTR